MDVCGFGNGGADQGFSYSLGPGLEIRIRQTSNTFDSLYTLRYGGEYPGDSLVPALQPPQSSCQDDPDEAELVVCQDDPDDAELWHANTGEVEMRVYFVIDGCDTCTNTHTYIHACAHCQQ